MRHFGCDYFGFGPFGPHFGPPRHGFEDFCGHKRRPKHCGRDREDFGPCVNHRLPRGPSGLEHSPHRQPHFGPDGDGEFGPSHGPCGRGHGPHRGPFGCGHHRRPHFEPERDSDGECGPSDFRKCGRGHGPPHGPFGPEHSPHRRPHCGPGADDNFGCRPCDRRHGPPYGPHGPRRHGPHKRPHFGPDGDSDVDCGPDFGPCHLRRSFHGPSCSRPGPYDRPERPGRRSPPPCCKGMTRESGCSKNKPQNANADSENEGRGRQNRPYSSQNKDGNEGNDTVLIQKIVVERVPRSSSI